MLLAIDTATDYGSVALAWDMGRITETRMYQPAAHAEILMPRILKLLGGVGAQLQDVTAVAVTQGPGSFTGLRVEMSLAKGLCYGLDIPLLCVPTLMVLASQALMSDYPLCAVLPSIRGEFFYQFFPDDPISGPVASEPMVGRQEKIAAALENHVHLVCDHSEERNNELCSYLERRQKVSDYTQAVVSAKPLALCALKMLQENRVSDRKQVEPLYLRVFPDPR